MLNYEKPDFVCKDLNNRPKIKEMPCVYAWKRNNDYLYVGMSMYGTRRPFTSHHVINVTSFLEGDTISIWIIKENKRVVTMYERAMIHKFRPLYNKAVIYPSCVRITKLRELNLSHKPAINPYQAEKRSDIDKLLDGYILINGVYEVGSCPLCDRGTVRTQNFDFYCNTICKQRGERNEMLELSKNIYAQA